MEIKEIKKTKEELTKEYNNLPEEERQLLECSYSTVSETKASEDRLTEIKEFSKKMGYKKIGVAFCKGLRDFGLKVDEELSRDFEVYSACCNLNTMSKSDINVKPIKDSEEIACNPLAQAEALNEKDVDIVIKCGFCLGHDILFSKNIRPPATTLIVKDRKNKHNTSALFL